MGVICHPIKDEVTCRYWLPTQIVGNCDVNYDNYFSNCFAY
jgi:hypothetical protein